MTDNSIEFTGEQLAKANEEVMRLGLNSDNILSKMLQQLKNYSQAMTDAAKTTGVFNDITKLSNEASKIFGTSIENTSEFFEKLSHVTQEQSNALSVLSVGLLGVSKIFNSLGADNRGLQTFSGQIKEIVNSADKLTEPFQILAKSFGFDVNSKNLSMVKGYLLDIANNLGQGTDKAMQFSRGIFDLAARTGQLKDLYNQAGPGLENLINLSENYNQKLFAIGATTNTMPEKMGEYFNMLNKLPGLLDDNVSSGDQAADTMNQMAKMIQLAHGTGQSFEEVLTQTTTAFETFGLRGNDALNMVSRASQLSRELGITLDDTKGLIGETANSFRMLGDNTTSVSRITEQFFNGLRNSGLGVKPALDTIRGMTDALANLNIAQKAFISARSGGPGGLLGGIQIERDLASGKADEVLNKIRQSFTQQVGGRIMTREDVNTQADAREFTRQRALLQSGAFGNIAKSDEQAAAILKAFSSPGQIDKRTADQVLNESVKEGANYEKLTATTLAKISNQIEAFKSRGQFAAARVAQGMTEGESGRAVNAYMDDARRRSVNAADGRNNSLVYNADAIRDLPKMKDAFTTAGVALFDSVRTKLVTPDSLYEKGKQNTAEYNATHAKVNDPNSPFPKYQNRQSAMEEEFKREMVAKGNALPTRSGGLSINNMALARDTANKIANKYRSDPNANASPIQKNSEHPTEIVVNVYLPDGSKQVSQTQVQLNSAMKHGVNGNR